ncbi:translation initiation factor IF-2-like [Canis lupus familiaris]|uniref:translation initiation factor IF-2-like n=1 Tax=Canis lupus familiaris TaxID=9615 RepID=UPI0018F40E15|nr:translation initiation factor IF-2-like [Canis lupus familiaris]
MMVAAVRSPFSAGGAAMMQSPGPASPPRARSLPFLRGPLRRVDVSRPTRTHLFLHFAPSDNCPLYVPTRDGPGTRTAARGLGCRCKRCTFASAGTPFRSEGSLRTASAYARKDEDEMAKAALRGRGGRSLGAAGRWARPCPVDPRSLPSSSHSPSPTFAHFFPAPVPRARQRGCDGGGGGTPPGGSKVGRDPAGGGGARPLLRAAAVLPGRRRAGQPFEMRGAADHWSPGWGWERAAAREGPRTREGSPVRSAPRPATARELRRGDEGGQFVRNRPAPLRGPGRSRPARPAGAPGAGTARTDPAGAGAACGGRRGETRGAPGPGGASLPDPRSGPGGRVRGFGAVCGAGGALPRAAGWGLGLGPGPGPAAASPPRDARSQPRRPGPGRGRPGLEDALGELTPTCKGSTR